MRKDTLQLDEGLVELTINNTRTVRFNPSDVGFAEDLYALAEKLNDIHKSTAKAFEESGEDYKVYFSASKAEDEQMRAAVDDFFGEGFCRDIFPHVRLYALSDGLTVIENFLYGLVDKMDDDISANMSKRNARIAKYTQKYAKYRKK